MTSLGLGVKGHLTESIGWGMMDGTRAGTITAGQLYAMTVGSVSVAFITASKFDVH
jgi:hypothetical protein